MNLLIGDIKSMSNENRSIKAPREVIVGDVINAQAFRVGFRKPGKVRVEKAGVFWILVSDFSGINWTVFPDKPGAVLFDNEFSARAAARALNKE